MAGKQLHNERVGETYGGDAADSFSDPSLQFELRIGAGFVTVHRAGKTAGETVTVAYKNKVLPTCMYDEVFTTIASPMVQEIYPI
jgi:microcystin-dependent protein